MLSLLKFFHLNKLVESNSVPSSIWNLFKNDISDYLDDLFT